MREHPADIDRASVGAEARRGSTGPQTAQAAQTAESSPTTIYPKAMTLAVVTDSAACLPPALADRCGIEVVPLHAIEDGETPSTARPSVAELAAAYASAFDARR